MERQRLFFVVTVGALLVVLAIFGVVVLVMGNDDDQGGNINEDPSPAESIVVDRGADYLRLL